MELEQERVNYISLAVSQWLLWLAYQPCELASTSLHFDVIS